MAEYFLDISQEHWDMKQGENEQGPAGGFDQASSTFILQLLAFILVVILLLLCQLHLFQALNILLDGRTSRGVPLLDFEENITQNASDLVVKCLGDLFLGITISFTENCAAGVHSLLKVLARLSTKKVWPPVLPFLYHILICEVCRSATLFELPSHLSAVFRN